VLGELSNVFRHQAPGNLQGMLDMLVGLL
jgi:hypothetical protein